MVGGEGGIRLEVNRSSSVGWGASWTVIPTTDSGISASDSLRDKADVGRGDERRAMRVVLFVQGVQGEDRGTARREQGWKKVRREVGRHARKRRAESGCPMASPEQRVRWWCCSGQAHVWVWRCVWLRPLWSWSRDADKEERLLSDAILPGYGHRDRHLRRRT